MIIDAHAHVWPDKVAERALGSGIPNMQRFGDGTVSGLAATMDSAGIDKAVCLAVANTPQAVEKANGFVGGLDRSRFIPFGSIHADLAPEENVASLRRHDLHGAKVHPLFQHYGLDDPGLLATLDAMRGEFVVTVHVGKGGHEEGEQCTPAMLAELVRQLPGLDVIACHLGGYKLLEDADDEVIGLPCHLDTSWPPGLSTVDRRRIRAMIERHGAERVVFASDWPTADPGREVEAIRDLGLSDDLTDAILGGNLERLLADR